jgi:glyceraldehyde 3-phosphate dehydrogenase
MIRIGINGFGRIGRCVTRHIISDRRDMQIVQINATGSVETNTHLLKYDSVHGRYTGNLQEDIIWTAERDIELLKWDNVDVVLECTGSYNNGVQCINHTINGARNVIISAPAENCKKTIVYGVNHNEMTSADHIVSNASCTTNCLAPLLKVIDESCTIINGQMTTIHSYTGDQNTIDKKHSDPYRARAGAINMIPTSTGAADAIGKVYPKLAGKIKGSAIRVPTPNVSCIDLTVNVEREVDEELVNEFVKYAAQTNEWRGIIKFETSPLVSSDFNTTTESCIFVPDQTRVVDNHLVRVLAWYDNEWAFSCRMADVAAHMMSIK